jgi:hypothetical protein
VYRYRLIDETEAVDLGTYVSPRLTFQVGERIARAAVGRLVIVNIVEAEAHENVRAYLVVRPDDGSDDLLRPVPDDSPRAPH